MLEAGQVIRVRDWPGAGYDRYVVKSVREVADSDHPTQVDARRIENVQGRGEMLTALHTFPLECVYVDERKTRQREAMLARVEHRLSGGQ